MHSSSDEDESDGDDAPACYIDPAWLSDKSADSVCGVCLGVMQKPASGCREGHSFCQACLAKALRKQRRCPTCRQHISWTNDLVPNRTAENIIANMRCGHATQEEIGEAGPSAAKRAKLAPASPIAVAGCGWKGTVGGLADHLGECQWTEVQCQNKGCTKSMPRKDVPAHDAVCGKRMVECSDCKMHMMRQSLAEHQRLCIYAETECPSEGCHERRCHLYMWAHLQRCEHLQVPQAPIHKP